MRTLDMTTRSEGFSWTSLIVIRYNQMKVLQNPDSFEISVYVHKRTHETA